MNTHMSVPLLTVYETRLPAMFLDDFRKTIKELGEWDSNARDDGKVCGLFNTFHRWKSFNNFCSVVFQKMRRPIRKTERIRPFWGAVFVAVDVSVFCCVIAWRSHTCVEFQPSVGR